MSRTERKRGSLIVLSVLFFVVYFFVAALPLGKELSFAPQWALSTAVDRQPDPSKPSPVGDYRLFSMGSRAGYYTVDGDVPLSFDNSSRRAISTSFYQVPASASGSTQFTNLDGKRQFSAQVNGQPQFKADRLFFFNPDNTGVSEVTASGAVAWHREFNSPLTVFDANKDEFLCGSLGGDLSFVSAKGEPIFNFSPGGSRLPVILGVALSQDGSLAASVSGIDPERFLLYERKAQGYKVVYHQNLDSDLRRHLPLKISSDNRFVLFEQADSLSIFDRRTRAMGKVPTRGRLKSIITDGPRGLVCLLTVGGEGAHLIAMKPLDTVVMDVAFPGSTFFADVAGDSIFVGVDGRLARIDVKEE
jgi:hypothetical protein